MKLINKNGLDAAAQSTGHQPEREGKEFVRQVGLHRGAWDLLFERETCHGFRLHKDELDVFAKSKLMRVCGCEPFCNYPLLFCTLELVLKHKSVRSYDGRYTLWIQHGWNQPTGTFTTARG